MSLGERRRTEILPPTPAHCTLSPPPLSVSIEDCRSRLGLSVATIGRKESLSHKLVFYPTNVGKEIIEKGKLNRLNMVLIIGTALARTR